MGKRKVHGDQMSSYRQVKQPNLDPVMYDDNGRVLRDWVGWCMNYVRTAFGTPTAPTAWDGWNRTRIKHTNTHIPRNVYVPIWFVHMGRYNGIYKNWGHAAIYHNGTVYSSPLSHKPTFDRWNSIEEVERRYHSTFAGWSEDILGTRVIAPITPTGGSDMIQPKDWPLIQRATRRIKYWEPNQVREMNAWTGKPWTRWLSEALNESRTEWQRREHALNELNLAKESITSLNARLAKSEANYQRVDGELKSLTKAYNELRDSQTQAPELDSFSLGELLTAAFRKTFKIK